ncbi:MAG: nucleoside hydrolase [Tissierellia bacterium]|nr:nucleoside hydrolase [Tissierellia bacterium]
MKKKIIIDTDPGIDDALAILLAEAIKEYEILGITLVSGNVHADQGLINLFRLSKVLGKKFPIYKATTKPLVRPFVDAKETHGEDGFGETYLDYEEYEYRKDGIDFIIDTLKETKEEVTIFALGPLTNIATALQKDPKAFEKARIISMGGAFKSHGNCSPVAEYNYWVDPHGADYCLQHLPRPLEIVPLDITREFLLTPSMISFMKRMDPNTGELVEKLTNFYMDFHWEYEENIGSVINDPVTMLVDRCPELFTASAYYCEVDTEGKAMGMLIVDEYHFYKKKPNALIYETIDAKEAMISYLKFMFGDHPAIEQKRGSYLYEFQY